VTQSVYCKNQHKNPLKKCSNKFRSPFPGI